MGSENDTKKLDIFVDGDVGGIEYYLSRDELVDFFMKQGGDDDDDDDDGSTSQIKRAKKRPKTCKSQILIVSVDMRNWEDAAVPSRHKYPVTFEFNEANQDYSLVVSCFGVRIFKVSLNKVVDDRFKEIFKAAHHKCLERELKRNNDEQRKQKQVNSRKTKKRKSQSRFEESSMASTIRTVSQTYKDIACPDLYLFVDSDFHWSLSFGLYLNYIPQSINKFSAETNALLDVVFSKDKKIGSNLSVSSSFIQREFIAQTISHTRIQLDTSSNDASINGLNVNLLPFQMKSLQWLLSKELQTFEDAAPLEATEFLNNYVSYGYEMISSSIFWNKFTNFILTKPEVEQIYENFMNLRRSKIVGAKGLLSEEMGLGKTIEILSLILLNKRKDPPAHLQNETFIANDGKTIFKTNTTLIICPNAILQQWINEIESHTTSSLKIFHYKGYLHVKNYFNAENIQDIVKYLSHFDIIITSYNVVSMEIHYAEYNASLRPRRTISPIKYDYSSPLSLMEFFRIILDEVQMLHSDSTKAAKCTSLLHRVHTWGVSGTPIQLIRDFQTVLSYLKISPFHELPEIVSSINNNVVQGRSALVNGVRFSLQELMNIFIERDLCIRHSKKEVFSQIQIPKQHNYIVPLDFAPVEWDNYLDLWNTFISVSGYSPNGTGSSRLTTTQLNQWLTRLRYLCCHAIFPESNNNAKNNQLNSTSGKTTLQNIDDVLKLMRTDAMEKLDSLYRDNYQLQIKSAQAKMELQNKQQDGIELLNSVKQNLIMDLKDKCSVDDPFDISALWQNKSSSPNPDSIGVSLENSAKMRIRAYLDLLHQCYFFIATGYYFLGSRKLENVDHENEKLALTESEKLPKTYVEIFSKEEMQGIEKNQKLEQEYYSYAEKLRERILFSRVQKVESLIEETKNYFQSDQESSKNPRSLQLIEFDDKNDYSNSILTSRCFKLLGVLINSLNEQAKQFNTLFEELQQLLYKPIIKEYNEENEEDKAQEYSTSIDDQDKMFAIFACIEQLLTNRDLVLTSDETIKVSKKLFKPQPGQKFSEYHSKMISTLKLINASPVKPVFDELKNSKIVRNISTNSDMNSGYEEFEDYLLTYEEEMTKMIEDNKNVRDSLKKLNNVYNAKLEYFSHLQRISDSLVSLLQLENSTRNSVMKSIKNGLKHKQNLEKISTAESRVKYLSSLNELKESITNHKTFSCAICLGTIYMGAIIKCGHFFCRKCIHSWLKNHSSCPLCKINASLSEVYNFKFQNEDYETDRPSSEESTDKKSGKNPKDYTSEVFVEKYDPIFNEKYSMFPQFNEVHKMIIKESFGAKIDFVVKLILFLKLKSETEADPEPPQIVLYSQSFEFLKVISKVLHIHDIKHLSCLANVANVGETISKFKKNQSITCLLLNVKALGAGLNLLNARHVFLLDPIINRGDELQAMSRNNRIGQTRETYVWSFMIRNSVEENIFKYKCILEGRRKKKGDATGVKQEEVNDSSTEEEREEFEMNESTGEQVAERHLWNCFFEM